MYRQIVKSLTVTITAIALVACSGGEAEDEQDDSADPLKAGQQLYNDNCLRCHLPLHQSEKLNRSADEITEALSTVSEMSEIELTTEEIELIALALQTDAPATTIEDIMQLSEVNCTSCHDASPGNAVIDLKTGTLEDLARRLVNQRSANDNCSDELLIDYSNPDNSLLLKLIDPDAPEQCMSKMPFNSEGIPREYMDDFRQWVEDIIDAASGIEIPDPDDNDGNALSLSPAASLNVLSKTKIILHGGAVTSAEYAQATYSDGSLNATAYANLIDDWMNTPQYEIQFKRFLGLTLQQETSNQATYLEQNIDLRSNNNYQGELRENLNQSFIRTAWRIVNNNQNFRNVLTTRNWEMTTAGLVALRFLDSERNRREQFRDLVNDNSPFSDRHFNDWRTIRFEVSNDAPKINSMQELADASLIAEYESIQDGGTFLVNAPRVGFFTTPAFFAKWPTNIDNQYRVVVNQTMISSLGLSFTAGDTTPVNHTDGLDEEHAPEGSDCRGCHVHLDPMRNAFTNVFNNDNQHAVWGKGTNYNIDFSFQGYVTEDPINSMYQFAQAISRHPQFAEAWVLKLCQWAMSMECDPEHPEVQNLVTSFQSSGYKMNTLVKAFFTSQLVTHEDVADTGTWPGSAIGMNRKSRFCHLLQTRFQQYREAIGHNNNLGRFNVCNAANDLRTYSSSVPDDVMPRGELSIVQIQDLDAFTHQSFDRICERIPDFVIGNENAVTNGSRAINIGDNEDVILDGLTQHLIGVPDNSPPYEHVRAIIEKVYSTARKPECTSDSALENSYENDGDCGLGLNKRDGIATVIRAACRLPGTMTIGL